MTQEEKELLLKDLCARLPYGVKTIYSGIIMEIFAVSSFLDNMCCLRWDSHKGHYNQTNARIGEFKPYLRPMSSMTEEENSHCDYLVYHMEDWLSYYDYLNSRYLDHRGLIDKGLALAAPEDMYQIKESKKIEQEKDTELTDFESALFSAFSDAWQEYLSGKEVNVAKWTREHSAELLEVAREQNPTWSEEDEAKRNALIYLVEEIKNQPLKRLEDWDGYISWLKSLKERYTWKPSDEQMEALLKLEEMHVLEHEKNQENAHLYMVIKSLMEQLLKLKRV